MNNFCSAPFRGFYQGLDGKISVCCQTPVLIDNKNYEEALQDEKIKNLRKKFLKNEIKDECKSCTKRVRNETTKLCESDNENFKVDTEPYTGEGFIINSEFCSSVSLS